MGWEDRDYARPSPRHGGQGYGRSLGGGLSAWSMVKTLIVANVAVHVLRGLLFGPRQADWIAGLGAMQTQAVLHGQVWRLFTSQYLHATGLGHIFMNMLGLYFLGPVLERTWGKRKFIAVYTIAGLCGNLFLMLIGILGWIDPRVPAIGASGCILGMLGACAVLFPRAEVYVYAIFPIKIRTAALLFGGMYVWNIMQRGSNFGGDACHLAGLAFGVWYAKAGDLWWVTKGSRALRGSFAGSGGVRPVARRAPGTFQRKMEQRKADAALIDKLLAKVYDGGLHSLSPGERKALTEATERQRQLEEQEGRVDRL